MRSSRAVVAVAFVVLLAATVTFAASPSGARIGADTPPQRPAELRRFRPLSLQERRAAAALQGEVAGRIVWSSRRHGNHDLYLLDLVDGHARRLTRDPNPDFLSRFSPDGERIVFLRGRKREVSFRDKDDWDVWVMAADGTAERRIAERAYHPSWTPDGDAVLFHRGARVYSHDLASGRESLLLDGTERRVGGDGALPEEGTGDPALAPGRDRLAVGVRFYGIVVLDLDGAATVRVTGSQTCQPAWVPGSDDLVWVEPAGNGGTRFMRGPSTGGDAEVFLDLPGPRSHEYFPRFSDDGRWLVFAAAAEGHEHDRADYEIYLWRVGEPAESARRVSWFAGNDQWPDIHVAPESGAPPPRFELAARGPIE